MASRRFLSMITLLLTLANALCFYISRLDNQETSNLVQTEVNQEWQKMLSDLNKISIEYSQGVDDVMESFITPDSDAKADNLITTQGVAASLISVLRQPMTLLAMKQLRNEDCGPAESVQMDIALAEADACLASLETAPQIAMWLGESQSPQNFVVSAISCRVVPAIMQCLHAPIRALGNCSANQGAVSQLLLDVDSLTLDFCRGPAPLIVDSIQTSNDTCISQGLRRIFKYVSPSYLSYVYPRPNELLQCQYIRYLNSMLNSVLLNYCGSTDFRTSIQEILGNFLTSSQCTIS